MNQNENYWIISREMFYKEILEKFPWAKEWAFYYIYVVEASRESVFPILEMIDCVDRDKFNEEKGYEYLAKYEKKKLNFVTIIPTCNRADSIEYLLSVVAFSYRRYGIDLIVYDSSDNDKTKKIVEEYQRNGYFGIKYTKYNGKFDGFSLDHKLINAYREFSNQYDYLWLCRDGLIPVIDNIREKFVFYKEMNIGCVIVDTKARTNNVRIEKSYSSIDDCERFLKDQASRLQTLGMLILSGKKAIEMVDRVPLTDATYSLWQMAAPFHLFAMSPFKCLYITDDIFAWNIKAAPTHFWSKATKAIEQWGKRWVTVIESMPNQYEAVKMDCMKVYTCDFHPFSIGNVFNMRAYGDLNIVLVKNNTQYLKRVTNTPIGIFYFVALLPKFIAKIALVIARKYPNRAHEIVGKTIKIIDGDKRNID